jgi:predicted nucleotidyltransferase
VKVEAPRRAVTLDEVRAHRDAIGQLGERFGVRNIRVFGSVARSEATPDSDLDLLVDVDRGHGYFDMAGFALGVEDELGVMTQVATPGGLKLRIRDRVLREAVALRGVTVPWRQIIATRNRVVHGYFEVDLDILWYVAVADVPALADQVRLIQSGQGR